MIKKPLFADKIVELVVILNYLSNFNQNLVFLHLRLASVIKSECRLFFGITSLTKSVESWLISLADVNAEMLNFLKIQI